MPAPLKHRAIGMIGAVGMLPIAIGLLQNSLTIPEAAKRAVILLVVLAAVEAVLMPLIVPLLQPPRPEPATDEASESA